MDVTIRKVDERAYRLFKARAAERGLNLGEALSLALQVWARWDTTRPERPRLSEVIPVFDWGPGSENLSEEIDQVLYGGDER